MKLPKGTYRYYVFYLKDGVAIWVEDFFDENKAKTKASQLTESTGIQHFVQKTDIL